jgi:hypothetical protein
MAVGPLPRSWRSLLAAAKEWLAGIGRVADRFRIREEAELLIPVKVRSARNPMPPRDRGGRP